MSSEIQPSDIFTQPSQVLYFNGPFNDSKNVPLRITNKGMGRIVWAMKCTNLKRLTIYPPVGVLDPKESVSLSIGCDPFDSQLGITERDTITVEWTAAPGDGPKKFDQEYFNADGIIRRKHLQVAYNA
ncbi:unnamed protein product [Soboliphyme baturini]|uniref:Major sperm protein n=1 Tax=Soboliphyme baturini TaxID=241478 RepID=A0A183IK70_9BILA|nr:unnamed protein product [Soboliphyme baturini]